MAIADVAGSRWAAPATADMVPRSPLPYLSARLRLQPTTETGHWSGPL